MLREKTVPPPVNDKRCRHCSLLESCMPAAIAEVTRSKTLLLGLFEISDS